MSPLTADDSLASVDSQTSQTTEERPDDPQHWKDITTAVGLDLTPREYDEDDDEAYLGGAQPRDDDDYWIDNDYGDAESQTLRSMPSHISVDSTASATSNSTVSEIGSVVSRSSSITLGRVASWDPNNSGYLDQVAHGEANDVEYPPGFFDIHSQTSSYYEPYTPPPPPLHPFDSVYPYQGGYSRPAGLGRTDSVTTIATEPDDSVPERRSPTPQPGGSAASTQNTNITNAGRGVATSPGPARSTRGVEAHLLRSDGRPSKSVLTMRGSWYMGQREAKAAQAQMTARKNYERQLQMARVDLEEVSRPRTRKPPRRLQAGDHGSLVLPEPQYRE